MLITPSQCRAARGVLNWSQAELARAAGVSRAMVDDFEKRRRRQPLALYREALQAALEAAGVVFPVREGARAFVGFDAEDPDG